MIFSPLEQFEISKLISFSFAGYSCSLLTNSSLTLLLMATLVGTYFITFSFTLYIVPTNINTILLDWYFFIFFLVRENIGKAAVFLLGPIFTVFTLNLFINVAGMIPYVFTVTSHLISAFSLAFILFISLNINSILQHGYGFLSLFLPSGSPLAIWPLLILIELISYIARVFSLSIRLFANLMAGHTLLKILANFSWVMLQAGVLMTFIAGFPLVIVFIIGILETCIAFLQAYVFTILTCIYYADSIHLH